jgi:hypothetical protein
VGALELDSNLAKSNSKKLQFRIPYCLNEVPQFPLLDRHRREHFVGRSPVIVTAFVDEKEHFFEVLGMDL